MREPNPDCLMHSDAIRLAKMPAKAPTLEERVAALEAQIASAILARTSEHAEFVSQVAKLEPSISRVGKEGPQPYSRGEWLDFVFGKPAPYEARWQDWASRGRAAGEHEPQKD